MCWLQRKAANCALDNDMKQVVENHEQQAHQHQHETAEILRRHKYVLVIGLVILIDVVYLLSYSTLKVTIHANVSFNTFNPAYKRLTE